MHAVSLHNFRKEQFTKVWKLTVTPRLRRLRRVPQPLSHSRHPLPCLQDSLAEGRGATETHHEEAGYDTALEQLRQNDGISEKSDDRENI